MLVEEGKTNESDFPWASDGYREPTTEVIDGVLYDGRRPNAYLDSLAIGLKGAETPSSRELVTAE